MIVEDKTVTKEIVEFKAKKLNPIGWIIMLIIAFVPVILAYRYFNFAIIFIIIGFFVAVIVAPILWKIAGKTLLNGLILKNFEIWKSGKTSSNPIRTVVNALLGLSIKSDYKYYLEANVVDINLNHSIPFFRATEKRKTACSTQKLLGGANDPEAGVGVPEIWKVPDTIR